MKPFLLAVTMLFAMNHAVHADAVVGKAAPDFTAATASGKTVKLSDYKGSIVVLEWSNPGCPFVKKFYNVGEMQKLQADAAAQKVVWLTVNSSAEGKQGYVDAASASAFINEKQAKAAEYLLDNSGKIGQLYGAKTTPHMFVIDKAGIVAYNGAIDNKPTPKSDDIAGATNHVTEAISALLAGKPVETSSAQAYGCAVKY